MVVKKLVRLGKQSRLSSLVGGQQADVYVGITQDSQFATNGDSRLAMTRIRAGTDHVRETTGPAGTGIYTAIGEVVESPGVSGPPSESRLLVRFHCPAAANRRMMRPGMRK